MVKFGAIPAWTSANAGRPFARLLSSLTEEEQRRMWPAPASTRSTTAHYHYPLLTRPLPAPFNEAQTAKLSPLVWLQQHSDQRLANSPQSQSNHRDAQYRMSRPSPRLSSAHIAQLRHHSTLIIAAASPSIGLGWQQKRTISGGRTRRRSHAQPTAIARCEAASDDHAAATSSPLCYRCYCIDCIHDPGRLHCDCIALRPASITKPACASCACAYLALLHLACCRRALCGHTRGRARRRMQ